MRAWLVQMAVLAAIGACAAGCENPFGRQYEYEEQIYLSVDGSAEVVVDASVAALVALRALPLDPAPGAPLDRTRVAEMFAEAGCAGARVARPWTRHGRQFIQVTFTTPDIRQLGSCRPLAWATYQFEREGNQIHYTQTVGAPAGARPGAAGWTGAEFVAFKLHLPSRILSHNVKRLDGSNGQQERGNILTWEQRLSDRLAGRPVVIDVRIEAQSILYRTLFLFVGAFAAAVLVMGALIWVTLRRARRRMMRTAA